MSLIVVSGALANKPFNGGEAWVRLSWVLGLQKLGSEVHFIEEIKPEVCTNGSGSPTSFEHCRNLDFFRIVSRQFALQSTLIHGNGNTTFGLAPKELQDLAEEADLLLNISGHLTWEPLFHRFRRKAYIDIDPGYTQFWHAAGDLGARLAGHDYFFTIGENIGTASCLIPTGNIPWRPTRQPVVLEQWPVVHASIDKRFTTVASWRGPFGPIQHHGRTYGLKVHEFRKFLELPRRSRHPLEIALNIHPADEKDLVALKSNGWHVVDPHAVASHPDHFRRYVQESAAEFSVAQGIYVDTACGWFSDRSVRYLASGKPVLAQDTGFGHTLPVGEGLLTFRTLEEAVEGIETIMADYDHHSRAARSLAEAYFDSDKILSKLLNDIGTAA